METKPTSLPRFLFFSIIAGLTITCGLILLYKIGLFERWKYVNQIPDPDAEVIGGAPEIAFFQSAEHKIYSCSAWDSDECWVPNVIQGLTPPQPCDNNHIAFLPILNAPRNAASCIHVNGMYIEGSYEVFYALEPDGKLWQWRTDSSAYEIFVLPFLLLTGGLGGALLGSIIWTAIRAAFFKRSPSTRSSLSKAHTALLALPWLCLLAGTAFWFFFLYTPANPPTNKKTGISQLSTAVAETVSVHMAEAAKKWQVEATPGAGSLRYRFTEKFCSAKWSTGWDTLPCEETTDASDRLIKSVTSPTINEKTQAGKALLVRLTPAKHMIQGEYPTLAIQNGDHLRMAISCTDDSLECDVIFDLSYEIQNKRVVLLGRWIQQKGSPMQAIDIDLSKLDGQRVRFYFATSKPNGAANNQELVILEPRIEK